MRESTRQERRRQRKKNEDTGRCDDFIRCSNPTGIIIIIVVVPGVSSCKRPARDSRLQVPPGSVLIAGHVTMIAARFLSSSIDEVVKINSLFYPFFVVLVVCFKMPVVAGPASGPSTFDKSMSLRSYIHTAILYRC